VCWFIFFRKQRYIFPLDSIDLLCFASPNSSFKVLIDFWIVITGASKRPWVSCHYFHLRTAPRLSPPHWPRPASRRLERFCILTLFKGLKNGTVAVPSRLRNSPGGLFSEQPLFFSTSFTALRSSPISCPSLPSPDLFALGLNLNPWVTQSPGYPFLSDPPTELGNDFFHHFTYRRFYVALRVAPLLPLQLWIPFEHLGLPQRALNWPWARLNGGVLYLPFPLRSSALWSFIDKTGPDFTFSLFTPLCTLASSGLSPRRLPGFPLTPQPE